MKSKPVKSTNGPAFFKLLRSAARQQSKLTGKTSVPSSDGGYAGKQIRSNISGNVAGKHDGKSHEPHA
jgi:hypothetical protein